MTSVRWCGTWLEGQGLIACGVPVKAWGLRTLHTAVSCVRTWPCADSFEGTGVPLGYLLIFGVGRVEANISADVGLDSLRGKYPRIPCFSGQGASRPTSALMLASTPRRVNTLGYHVCWGREPRGQHQRCCWPRVLMG